MDIQAIQTRFKETLNEILVDATDVYSEVGLNTIYVEWFRYNKLHQVSVRGTSNETFEGLVSATLKMVQDRNSDKARIKELMEELMSIEVK